MCCVLPAPLQILRIYCDMNIPFFHQNRHMSVMHYASLIVSLHASCPLLFHLKAIVSISDCCY